MTLNVISQSPVTANGSDLPMKEGISNLPKTDRCDGADSDIKNDKSDISDSNQRFRNAEQCLKVQHYDQAKTVSELRGIHPPARL